MKNERSRRVFCDAIYGSRFFDWIDTAVECAIATSSVPRRSRQLVLGWLLLLTAQSVAVLIIEPDARMVRRNPQTKIEFVFVDAGVIGPGQENTIGVQDAPVLGGLGFIRQFGMLAGNGHQQSSAEQCEVHSHAIAHTDKSSHQLSSQPGERDDGPALVRPPSQYGKQFALRRLDPSDINCV